MIAFLRTWTRLVGTSEPRTQRGGVSDGAARLLRCAACAARRSGRLPRRAIPLFGVAAIVLLTGSCASGRKPVYPVRGQMFVGDQPAAQAFVVFHPTDDFGPQATRPYGH